MTTLEELLRTRVARFVDRQPDWDAFADARVEGYRRAQHRYIGAGASGKTDARAIPAEQFTLSVMFVPPGQGNAAHTHEVEEVFFILDGKVKSECVWMSISPGVTTWPRASMTRWAARDDFRSIATMRPASTLTSASNPGAPLPSIT